MTLQQVQNQLSSVTYNEAINYYNQQRERFKNQYKIAIGDLDDVISENYINTFFNEVNSSSFQGKSFGLADVLTNKLEEALIQVFNNADLSQFDSLIQDSNKQYGELTNKGKQRLHEALFSILDFNIIHKELEQSLKQFGIGINNLDINDLTSWSRSYLVSNFYNKLRGQAFYTRKAVLAGYFEEALVHNAFSKLTKYLKTKSGAIQTGSKKIQSGKYKIDSVFDEYIHFFSQNLGNTFESSIDIDTNSLREGFGAQVKLWNPPWQVKKPRLSYKITSNINLFSQWQEKKSWIQGVLFLQNKVKEAMGDNVMYFLGNGVYWTADLIAQFKAMEYYLAFSHNGKEFTQTTAWEKIDMSKPFYD